MAPPTVASEIEHLYQIVESMLGVDSPLDFDHALPLASAQFNEKQINNIQRGLEKKLADLSDKALPVVTVKAAFTEDEASQLRVRFFRRYLKEWVDPHWYSDVPDDGLCWYFQADTEQSAAGLCRHWNDPRNRDYLESVKFECRAERQALRRHLKQLRDSGIKATHFGRKSDGILEDLS